MIEFVPRGPAVNLGFLPAMLSEANPRPAREQLDAGYMHGGGWQPINGFTLDQPSLALLYPGDPPMEPYAAARLRDEMIVVYPYDFVAVLQPDGSFEVARMD